MMTNLFSSFDPCSSSFFSNWASVMLIMLIIQYQFWTLINRSFFIINKLFMLLYNEFNMIIKNINMKGCSIFLISLLIFIASNNFLGLFPYIFTSSSHLTMTMTLSIPLWVSFMFYGWYNNMKSMFAHMVPLNTPNLLMPFMVIIETISNIIRPGTLAVRLSANMIAGHLLLTLLGNQTSVSNSFIISFMIIAQLTLLMLEVAVSLIQAYVFTILSTLYSSEVVSH